MLEKAIVGGISAAILCGILLLIKAIKGSSQKQNEKSGENGVVSDRQPGQQGGQPTGMMGYVKKCFQNYANFSGRARRAEYWYFCLFNLIITMILSGLARVAGGEGYVGTALVGLYSLYTLATLIPSLAVAWRRLHDIGKSGGCWFIILIPIAGAIILLVWLAKAGDVGDNAYGPDPKAE